MSIQRPFGNPTTATVVFAPIDSHNRTRADIKLPGVNDQDVINNWCQVGRRLLFLDGTIHLGGAILPPTIGTGFCLEGQGRDITTFYLDNGANDRMIFFDPTGDIYGFTFKNFSMDGNGVNQTDGGALRDERSGLMMGDSAFTTYQSLFENIYVTGIRHGSAIRLYGLKASWLKSIYAYNNGLVAAAWPCDGIYVKDGKSVAISDIHSLDNTDTGLVFANGLYLVLENATLINNTEHQITFSNGSLRAAINNIVCYGGNYGLRTGPFGAGGRTSRLLLSNSHFQSAAVAGLHIEDHDHFMMTNIWCEANLADYVTVNVAGTFKGRCLNWAVDFG